jgi:hypothetical protein
MLRQKRNYHANHRSIRPSHNSHYLEFYYARVGAPCASLSANSRCNTCCAACYHSTRSGRAYKSTCITADPSLRATTNGAEESSVFARSLCVATTRACMNVHTRPCAVSASDRTRDACAVRCHDDAHIDFNSYY